MERLLYVIILFVASISFALGQNNYDTHGKIISYGDSLLFMANDYDEAYKLFDSLQRIGETQDDNKLYLISKIKKATATALGKPSQMKAAGDSSRKAIEEAISLGFNREPFLAGAYYNLYVQLSSEGKNKERYGMLDSAERTTYIDSSDIFHPDRVNIYRLLGWWHQYRLGKYQKALSYYQNALKSDFNKIYWHRIMPQMIESASTVQNFIFAEQLADQYIEYTRANSDFYPGRLGNSYNQKALVYFFKNQYRESIEYYKKALAFFNEIDLQNTYDYYSALSNMGTALIWIGDYENSQRILTEAYELAKNLFGEKGFNTINTLNNLAVSYRFQKDFEEAEKIQKKVLALFESNNQITSDKLGEFHDTMALIYLLQEKYDEAEQYFKSSLDLQESTLGKNSFDYQQTYNNLARLYQITGDYEKSEEIAKSVRVELQKISPDNFRLILPFYNPLAYSYIKQDELKKAEKVFEEDNVYYLDFIRNYFQHLSEKQRNQFYKTFNNYINAYQAFCLQQARQNPELLEKFFKFQQQTKGILLNTSIAIRNRIQANGNIEAINLYKRIEILQQELGRYAQLSASRRKQLGINYDSLEFALNDLGAELSSISQVYSEDNKTYSTSEITKILKKDEAYVDIMRVPNYDFQKMEATDSILYAAFIIKGGSKKAELLVLPHGKEIEKAVQTYYKNSINFKVTDTHTYEMIWEPIERKLNGINKLYYTADGVYHKVNMTTLYDNKNSDYLIDKYDIQKISGFSDLEEDPDKKLDTEKGHAIFVGNPDFGAEVLQSSTMRGNEYKLVSPLPGTKEEIEKISTLFGKGSRMHVTTYTQNEAQELAVKNVTSPDVLHIATHGFFIEDSDEEINLNPLFNSGLLLAGANNSLIDPRTARLKNLEGIEDGILSSYETQAIDLAKTKLVVLSACETGLGKIENGEGVYGLQRSLKKAGVQNIIMSLWKVDDNVTKDFMIEFYTRILSGNSVRESFKDSQIAIKSKYPEPYYWGAFILI